MAKFGALVFLDQFLILITMLCLLFQKAFNYFTIGKFDNFLRSPELILIQYIL